MDEAGSSPRESGTTRLLCGDEEVKVPQELLEDVSSSCRSPARRLWCALNRTGAACGASLTPIRDCPSLPLPSPQRDIFSHVLSRETWEELLTEEERARLTPLLPQHPELPAEDIVRSASVTAAYSTEV